MRECDGMDLLPVLKGQDAPFDREVFWRYLNFDQQAVRKGRWKYLKIFENTFLFDVESDPLERGNLKERYPEIFANLKASFDAWDRTMLPLDPKAFTHGFSGADMADHFGVEAPVMHQGVEP